MRIVEGGREDGRGGGARQGRIGKGDGGERARRESENEIISYKFKPLNSDWVRT